MSGKLAEVGVQVAFQPVLRVADLSVFGYEALSRGAADPAVLFAGAVQESFARGLDCGVCRRAVEEFAKLGSGLLFVNLTPSAFLSPGGVVDAFRGLPPGCIVLEIAEQAFSVAPGEVVRAASRWRRAGFLVAVDGVGSGHLRLLVLAEVGPDFVKVDRSLLLRAAESRAARVVLLQLVSLARALGAGVVAEGVESGREFALARALGFDLAQGFLLGLPDSLSGS